jgi:hypothetical protein
LIASRNQKESTMTKLERVLNTATVLTTGDRNGGFRSDERPCGVKSPPAEARHTDTRSTRRGFLATSAAAGAIGLFRLAAPSGAQAFGIGPQPSKPRAATGDNAIRPFPINSPEADLVDLRRRIAATRWPDKETVNDESQGIRLAEMQALVHYWGNGYNWRNVEAKLNALPEFVTTIDGVDTQFIHVRSREPNALPLILTHGWPGSPLEFLKVIGPLTDPGSHGGRAQDAFDVVIPAIPGYGFSGKPTDLGWNPDRWRGHGMCS